MFLIFCVMVFHVVQLHVTYSVGVDASVQCIVDTLLPV